MSAQQQPIISNRTLIPIGMIGIIIAVSFFIFNIGADAKSAIAKNLDQDARIEKQDARIEKVEIISQRSAENIASICQAVGAKCK